MTLNCFLALTVSKQESSIAQAFQALAGSDINLACAASPALSRYYLYDAVQTLADQTPIVKTTPLTGATVIAQSFKSGGNDATDYITPAGTIAAMTWRLPASADSKVGMIRRIFTTQTITALTLNTVGGGTIQGAALTTLLANTGADYRCVSVSGAGTWIRI